MTHSDALAVYSDRAARFLRDREQHERRSLVVSYLRLATFLGGLTCLTSAYTFFRVGIFSSILAWTGSLALVAFVWLIAHQAGIERRRAWFDALWRVNDRGGKRLARD